MAGVKCRQARQLISMMTFHFEMYLVIPTIWHQCGAPSCHRKIRMHYYACTLHQHLLGFELNARMHTAWLERCHYRQLFENTRKEAVAAWAAPRVLEPP